MAELVYKAADPVDANIIAGYLRTRGISVEIRGGALWSVMGEIPPGREVEPGLYVPEIQLAAARKLLDERDASAGQPDWQCGACGETLTAAFAACWQCGTLRPKAV